MDTPQKVKKEMQKPVASADAPKKEKSQASTQASAPKKEKPAASALKRETSMDRPEDKSAKSKKKSDSSSVDEKADLDAAIAASLASAKPQTHVTSGPATVFRVNVPVVPARKAPKDRDPVQVRAKMERVQARSTLFTRAAQATQFACSKASTADAQKYGELANDLLREALRYTGKRDELSTKLQKLEQK
jgi:hypothetical protein